MLKNYFKIAWRSLMKNRLVTSINILGLALGIATCLVIGVYVLEEFGYDRFYTHSDRIYRVNLKAKVGGEALNESKVMAPVAETFLEEIPGIENATRISSSHSGTKISLNNGPKIKGTTVFVDPNFFAVFDLPFMTDIHLSTTFQNSGDYSPGGDLNTVLIYVAIAVFMLLIACINFVNLSTAGASQRVKEIGVRKVMGSDKQHLVFQFLSESFVSICLAFGFAVLIASFALPFFNDFADKNLSLSVLITPGILVGLGGLIALVTLLAGGYPAFYLSGLKPIESLKKKLVRSNKVGFRSSLVVFQFAISVCLIIGTIVVSRQMSYIQSKDIGYERDQIIVLRNAGELGQSLDVFKDRLMADPRVLSVSKSAYIPAGPTDDNSQNLTSDEAPDVSYRVMQYGIDEAYIPTMGMEIVQGRNFSLEFGSEEGNIIINETAAREMGIADDPVGKQLKRMTDNQGGRAPVKVVGVVKDFVARSLREPIRPLVMEYNPYHSLILKVDGQNVPQLIAEMEQMWAGYQTNEAFQYSFLDELYNETYIKEAKMGSFLTTLALMTIFVACLGLFGLVTFTAEQRVKEIGIRKVLGASVGQVVGMLAKDFIKLVVISLLIAIPAGKYLMDLWLEDFAYHIEISWWVFVLASLIAVGIALATISLRSVKAAVMNPVDSLKSE